jgi:hypothetical protein
MMHNDDEPPEGVMIIMGEPTPKIFLRRISESEPKSQPIISPVEAEALRRKKEECMRIMQFTKFQILLNLKYITPGSREVEYNNPFYRIERQRKLISENPYSNLSILYPDRKGHDRSGDIRLYPDHNIILDALPTEVRKKITAANTIPGSDGDNDNTDTDSNGNIYECNPIPDIDMDISN